MPESAIHPRTWLVLGDKRGDNGQVETIAAALGWSFERRHLQMKPKWVKGKPRVRARIDHIDLAKSDPLEPPWPDLVITVGRRPSSVALWIRKQSGGRTRIVQVGKPSTRVDRFDLVVASSETLLPPLANVVRTAMPLMQVEQDPEEIEAWRQRFTELPRPLVGFLIGGPTRPYIYDKKVLSRLITEIRAVAERGGTAYISTSRRTPEWLTDALAASVPASAKLFRWSATAGENPYKGIVALADGLVVTGDSISMIVEGVRLGRPVAILPPSLGLIGTIDQARRNMLAWLFAPTESDAGSPRQRLARLLYRLRIVYQSRDFHAFHRLLVDQGKAVWAGEPFRAPAATLTEEADRVAGYIRRMMGA